MSTLHAAVLQHAPVADAATNRVALAALCAQAPGAAIYVAPEYSAWYSADPSEWHIGAEEIDGAFVGFLRNIATENDALIVAGFIEREGDALFNAVVAVDASGVRGHYRKVHLYDAFGAAESRWLSHGEPQQPHDIVEYRGFTIGLMTCYDLRFPEIARTRIDAGAQVLVVPSDWVSGEHKVDHWRTLTSARAIENIAWLIAADHPAPSGVGHSRIVDPMGAAVELGDTIGVLRADISLEVVTAARSVNPALRARRFSVIPR